MFSSNAQKKHFADSMNKFAEAKTLAEIRKRGQSLPGHVIEVVSSMIVTVAFDVKSLDLPQVTMPVFGPEYLRQPIQVGDLGAAISFSTAIDNVSGLGDGTNPDLSTLQGNLSMLAWLPLGNINWGEVDLNTQVLYGPPGGNGVLLLDQLESPGVSVSAKNGVFKVIAGSHTLEISSTGIVFDGITWGTHEHDPGSYQAGGDAVTGQSDAPRNP